MSSLLTNPDCVAKWLANYPNKPSLKLLKDYLDGVISGLQARQDIYESFRKYDEMFFQGLATKEGFGCSKRPLAGNDLIRVAGLTRNCPEALNYLGICYLQLDPLAASKLFYHAARAGHGQARDNLRFMRGLLPRPTSGMPRLLCAV